MHDDTVTAEAAKIRSKPALRNTHRFHASSEDRTTKYRFKTSSLLIYYATSSESTNIHRFRFARIRVLNSSTQIRRVRPKMDCIPTLPPSHNNRRRFCRYSLPGFSSHTSISQSYIYFSGTTFYCPTAVKAYVKSDSCSRLLC